MRVTVSPGVLTAARRRFRAVEVAPRVLTPRALDEEVAELAAFAGRPLDVRKP